MSKISDAPQADNMQKYDNYKEQFKRLDAALKYKFYLEATFISYAIMEDRTESILRHAGKYDTYLKSRRGYYANIDSKIKYIKKLAECKTDLMHKYFSDDLLDKISKWKDDRNRLIHALLKQNLTTADLEEVAILGKELTKALRNRASCYNRAIDRRTQKNKEN